MTRRELLKKLKAAGWIIEEGNNHSKAVHRGRPEIVIPIPRHKKDIPTGTLESILKATGLKEKKPK